MELYQSLLLVKQIEAFKLLHQNYGHYDYPDLYMASFHLHKLTLVIALYQSQQTTILLQFCNSVYPNSPFSAHLLPVKILH